MTTPEPLLLSVSGIDKIFPGVKALDGVDFDLRAGEVHALLGENGAGKSTLVKILTGIHGKDKGSIKVLGEEVAFANSAAAREKGIAAIYQEFALATHLDVGTNIFLGRIPNHAWFIADRRQVYQDAQKLLDRLKSGIDAHTRVAELGVGKRQMVEIAKAISMGTRILIMDEPTSALSSEECGHLFQIITDLKQQGIGIIFISHKLDEIHRICDRVSVMRDGRKVGTLDAGDISVPEIIRLMVGREIGDQYYKRDVEKGEVTLEVRGLSDATFLRDISFTVRKGEILGLAGLVGAGRTETAQCLFGVTPIQRGEILVDGKAVRINSPGDAVANGIVMLSEDRKNTGLFLQQSVTFNVTIAAMNAARSRQEYYHLGCVDVGNQRQHTSEYVNRLSIKTPSIDQIMRNLSGGNQQKTILAKWLLVNPRVIIFDEPTRGIDVGAKQEIYRLMHELLQAGMAIIMISSELPEIMALSDRILVISHGRATGVLDRSEATQEKIMTLAVK
ncbi:MAG: sugar ABC transporter ATP-binding protein [Planctomycetota bacterium]|jgi:ABC-type sugar transport system ATPase subunit|nr:sugar ABC transporter ATP-binding protein [Planctomycetota bacterium]